MGQGVAILCGVLMLAAVVGTVHAGQSVERWGLFELTLKGPSEGPDLNPFLDVQLQATFMKEEVIFSPEGFYDGDGTYRIRFSPPTTGEWTYETHSNHPELNGRKGSVVCTAPSEGNHGPVRVRKTHYLAYADGTPYFQVGTTCYAWAHQGDALEEQTLETLAASPFNKIRMCVFPKHYTYNQNEPQYYPFPRKGKRNDYSRFVPAFFRHFEKRVGQLLAFGIEADLILFHPYDRWGYKAMPSEVDDRYLRYVVARFAAYRNVWWSFANEYDLMLKIPNKRMADWDRFMQIVQKHDPYGRLRGIHNCRGFYDHTKPWVTHCSVQSSDFQNPAKWRKQYGKPVIYDECRYEGNIPQGWGNISAEEMVHRFWLGTIQGCYVGHGETYKHPQDILWWSKGGVLHGESPERIAFYRTIMEPLPFEDMQPVALDGAHALVQPGRRYLIYFSEELETAIEVEGGPYKVEDIDTWDMTSESIGTALAGTFRCEAKGHHLLRLEPYAPGEKVLPDVKVAARPEVSPDKPIVELGTNPETLRGQVRKLPDGSYDLADGEDWGWIDLGRVRELEGLKSFTILGWARASCLETGMGGNRIAFNLKYNRSGFDLVHHRDGRMRLSVNEWPDKVKNDSSAGTIAVGRWVFFAAAYDGERTQWYFGGPKEPAVLDRTTSYSRGATGRGSGPITIGNYNETIHRHGKNRQFRGQLKGIRIFGSTKGADGALDLDAIRKLQTDAAPGLEAAPR